MTNDGLIDGATCEPFLYGDTELEARRTITNARTELPPPIDFRPPPTATDLTLAGVWRAVWDRTHHEERTA